MAEESYHELDFEEEDDIGPEEHYTSLVGSVHEEYEAYLGESDKLLADYSSSVYFSDATSTAPSDKSNKPADANDAPSFYVGVVSQEFEKEIDYLPIRDWQGELQALLKMLECHEKYIGIAKLGLDFRHAASLYARVIVSECKLPETQKTIHTAALGGVAGGFKVICQGILFKVAVDKHGMYGSDANAAKAAAHEFRSTTAFFDLNLPDVQLPMMAIIDYRGFRVTAMSLLPISGHDTLVYGSSDGGRSVAASDPTFNGLMERAGKLLNLKPHAVGRDKKQVLYMPVDVEGHITLKFRSKSSTTPTPSDPAPSAPQEVKSKSYVVLDLARLFPPQMPLVPPDKTSKYRSYLFELLRPEYVKANPVPLSSDAFSPFNQMDDNGKEHNAEVAAACQRLLTNRIPQFVSLLERGSLTALMPMTQIDCSKLVSLLHRHGINLRFLGITWRLLKNLHLRRVALTEMVARVIKDQINEEFRSTTQRVQLPVEEPYREAVVIYLNKVFDARNDIFWQENILPAILKKFQLKRLDLSMADVVTPHNSKEQHTVLLKVDPTAKRPVLSSSRSMRSLEPTLRTSVDALEVWERVSELTGVTLRQDSLAVLVGGMGISSSDVKDLKSRVRVIDVVNRALAISVSLDAHSKIGTEAYRLYLRAHQLFAECLTVSASNASTFYHWGLMLHEMSQHSFFSNRNHSLKLIKLGALPKLAQAIHINPLLLDAHAALAWSLIDFLLHPARFEAINNRTAKSALKDTTTILERIGHHIASSFARQPILPNSAANGDDSANDHDQSITVHIASLTSSTESDPRHTQQQTQGEAKEKPAKKKSKTRKADAENAEQFINDPELKVRFDTVVTRIEKAADAPFCVLLCALNASPSLRPHLARRGALLTAINLFEASFLPKQAFLLVAETCPNLTSLELRNALMLDAESAGLMFMSSAPHSLTSPSSPKSPAASPPPSVSFSKTKKSSSEPTQPDGDRETKRFLARLQHLVTLRLHCCDHLTDIENFEKIYWPSLQSLLLLKCGLSDGFFSSRLDKRMLPNLNHFSASGTNITDASLTKIATHFGSQLTRLEVGMCLNLQLASCFCIMVNAPSLIALKALTHLDLSGCRSIASSTISHYLKAIGGPSTPSSSKSSTKILVSPMPAYPLTVLNLDGCSNITEDVWTILPKKCPSLTSLSVEKTTANKQLLQLLGQHCPHLTRLHAPACKGLDPLSLLSVLQGCTKLEYLDASFWMWGKDELDPKKLAKNWNAQTIPPKLALRHLYLCSWNMDSASLNLLISSCPLLLTIDISNCVHLGPEVFTTLSKNCPDLDKVIANGFVLTDDAVEELSIGCNLLRSISFVRAHELTDQSLLSLTRCSKLTHLTMSHSPFITNEGIQLLVTECPTLSRLGLKGSKLVTPEFMFEKLRHSCERLRIEMDAAKMTPWDFPLP